MNESLLKRVCNAPGVSGFEEPVQTIVSEALKSCCDEVASDRMGNVVGVRKAAVSPQDGKEPIRLMIAAHADEVGLMVKHIDGKGLIHFIQLGAVNPQVAQSQRVTIHGTKPVRGVIVPKKEKEKVKLNDLLIDTGLPKEELTELVSVGDVATFEDDVSVLNDNMWVGRNFDDRIGTYCLLEAMRQVGNTQVEVHAVSSVQEEVGVRGVGPAAFACAPDIGIAIDGSLTRGAYVEDKDNLCELGKGTGIYMIDKLTIGHPRLVRYLFDLCEKHNIPYQRNIGGGTDAQAMQQSRGGVIATTIGAPVRYMHSTVQLCNADDVDATVALLIKFMENAHEFMNSL